MLKTETNTTEMYQRVKKAAAHILKDVPTNEIEAFFEHGQWWVEIMRTGAQYSVVDAEGGDSFDGFDLEQVSEGEEP